MIRAIIIDDEKTSIEALRGLCARYCTNLTIVAEANGFKSAIQAIKRHNPDVIFLDIQMPDGSGFKLLEEIGEINFEIIFTTAYDQYAIKAIKYSALDYLLKPIAPDELKNAIEKVEQKKATGNINKNIKILLDTPKSEKENSHNIVLSTSLGMHIIDINSIIRCESDDYYTWFFFNDGKKLLISKTLKENEELLKDHHFIRPHKSHLINVKHIKQFVKNNGGYIVMSDKSIIPVSRRKKEQILNIINHL